MNCPLFALTDFVRELLDFLGEGVGNDADGAALLIYLEAVSPLTDDDIRDVAFIVAHQPSGVGVELHTVGILERTGVVHVDFVHAGGEDVQVVQHLVDVRLVSELVAENGADESGFGASPVVVGLCGK